MPTIDNRDLRRARRWEAQGVARLKKKCERDDAKLDEHIRALLAAAGLAKLDDGKGFVIEAAVTFWSKDRTQQRRVLDLDTRWGRQVAAAMLGKPAPVPLVPGGVAAMAGSR